MAEYQPYGSVLQGFNAAEQFRQQQLQNQQASQMNQIKLSDLIQQQQEQKDLQGIMAQTGGDPVKAYQALTQHGTPASIALAEKFAPLVKIQQQKEQQAKLQQGLSTFGTAPNPLAGQIMTGNAEGQGVLQPGSQIPQGMTQSVAPNTVPASPEQIQSQQANLIGLGANAADINALKPPIPNPRTNTTVMVPIGDGTKEQMYQAVNGIPDMTKPIGTPRPVFSSQLTMNKPPAGYRFTADGNLEATPGGPADVKMQGKYNQDTSALNSSINSMDRLASAANELLNHPGLKNTTGLIGAIPNVPGSQASNAAALMNTLKSQVAFGVLQDMRNNSKTGGALGQVSDKEGQLLQSNLSALDKSQSYEALKQNLQKIIDYSNEAKDRLNSAYNQKYSDQVNTTNSNSPLVVIDPNGGKHTFKSPQAAAAFKKAAGIP